jgi:putative Holliday junction resolvase
MSLPNGRRVAIDFGQVRCGIASSDALGLLPSPLETVATEKIIERIKELSDEQSILTIYIGLPAHLSGAEGSSAQLTREFASKLAQLRIAPVHLVDERLSTKSASAATELVDRFGIDAVAAAMILELALAGEKASGKHFGELVND